MPASTDLAYLNAVVQAIRQQPPEEALKEITEQYPMLDPVRILKDLTWAKQLKQRGYSRQEILEDLHLG